jgi:hypothetical protein
MIRNLTPHVLNLQGLTPLQSEGLVRVAETRAVVGELDGIQLITKTFGEVEGLPAPEQGTLLIVSALAAQAAWATGRIDVACPGDPIRDDAGRVIGAASLCVAPGWTAAPAIPALTPAEKWLATLASHVNGPTKGWEELFEANRSMEKVPAEDPVAMRRWSLHRNGNRWLIALRFASGEVRWYYRTYMGRESCLREYDAWGLLSDSAAVQAGLLSIVESDRLRARQRAHKS